MIAKRLVLNFPGFEKTTAESQLDRMRHCAGKTGEVWKFSHERVALEQHPGESHAVAVSVTKGPNWQVETRTVLFAWGDIINEYEGAAHPGAFLANMPKFLAFFADGTVWRYWRASKRYFAFTVFPILLLLVFAALAAVLSWFAAGLFLSGPAQWAATLLAAAALTLVLARWPGERAYLLLTINDWGFARDMVHRSNPRIEARYRTFAEVLAREIAAGGHDEIVVCGHSFGAVWAVAALSRALEKDPHLLKDRPVVFLALGSSLLKIALVPAAGWMRDDAARVMSEPGLLWHEIQTKDDIIAFYKADPFQALGISGYRAELRIDRVNYKKAMNRKRYRKMRRSFYETHRQYILYQDVRVPFDYMLRLFGPLPAAALARTPELAASIDGDGRLV